MSLRDVGGGEPLGTQGIEVEIPVFQPSPADQSKPGADRKLQLRIAGRQTVPRVVPSAIGVDEERQPAVLGVRAGEDLLRHHLAIRFGQGRLVMSKARLSTSRSTAR